MKALFLFALVIVTQCGEDDNALSYSFDENGCTTGYHSFTSMQDFCEALSDEALNEGCAFSERMDLAQEKGC